MGGILAIDYGTKKTGFAVADALRIAVRPLETLRVDGEGDELLEGVESLLDERDVSVILLGLPKSEGGGETEQAQRVRAFAGRLGEKFPDHELVLYDERLTTKEAESRMREAGLKGREAARLRDSWSAWVLLEDWIRSGEPRET